MHLLSNNFLHLQIPEKEEGQKGQEGEEEQEGQKGQEGQEGQEEALVASPQQEQLGGVVHDQ